MGIDALPFHLVGDVQHVGRCDHDDVRLKILDQLDLLLGLPARHRNNGAAQTLGAIVGTKATGEQAITVSHMYLVTPGAATGPDGARHNVGPGVDVALGVTNHGWLAGGTTGSVHPNHIRHGGGKHTKRVVVAQIRLGGKWHLGQIVQRVDVHGLQADVIKRFAVERHVGVSMDHTPAQALQLFVAQLIDAGGFHAVKFAKFLQW